MTNYNSTVPHYVYLIKITTPTITLYKIGYSKNILNRINSIKSTEKPSSEVHGKGIIISNISIVWKYRFANKQLATEYEKYLHKLYLDYKYIGSGILTNGNSELFIDTLANVWKIPKINS